jgi:hypothetical protein
LQKDGFVNLIAAQVPSAFLMALVEQIESSYFEAFRKTEDVDVPERWRLLPQQRHYLQNIGFRRAAAAAGVEHRIATARNTGEWYPVARCGHVHLARSAIEIRDHRVRPAQHRRALATMNRAFEPVNLDLFTGPSAPVAMAPVAALVLTVNPLRNASQSTPAEIMLGIPYSDLGGWHLLEPIHSLIAQYRPEVDIQVPDLALVKIRKRIEQHR